MVLAAVFAYFLTNLGITRMDTVTENENLPGTKDIKHTLLGLVDEGCAPHQPSLACGRTAT